MKLILIGYRGCGKTTIAQALSQRLNIPWVDVDDVVESHAGKSIREIFADSGEPEFRRLERLAVSELLARQPLIVSAGGGSILNADTRRDFQAAGPVVWLTAPVETILARLETDSKTADRRPNLTTAGGADEVRQLLARREPLYRETATWEIPTENRVIPDIVEDILQRLAALPSPTEAAR